MDRIAFNIYMPEKFDLLYVAWMIFVVGYVVVWVLYFIQDFIPTFLHGLISYGKTYSHKKITLLVDRLCYVPNSWFTHFYIVGMFCCLVLLYSFLMLCFNGKSQGWVAFIASYIVSNDAAGDQVECTSILLGLIMLLVQVSRRLLECLFVSIFTGKIHLAHYVVANIFYMMDAVSIAAPYLSRLDNKDWYQSCMDIRHNIQWYHVLSIILFAWASIHQNKCHVILANLRKTSNKKAPTKVYKIPHGDWFEYVSSPHYFAEILIYISFVVMQKGANLYTWLLLLFVIQNLSLAATITHSWYHNKFKEYPKSRSRLIPLVF